MQRMCDAERKCISCACSGSCATLQEVRQGRNLQGIEIAHLIKEPST